ncbi:MAG: IS5/IS1182 family transposase, partial [Mastigocladus sp. ERB_26_1]
MKGRKGHIIVDTLGLLLVVVITAADVSEQAGAKQILSKLNSIEPIWDLGRKGKMRNKC